MKRVVVGMSGGVDSSVVAALLKEQGYEVIGLFMNNWQDKGVECSAEQDYKDVQKVCEELDIQYYSINFAKEYKKYVFEEFLDDLNNGFTPNPDVLCNREIKFKLFYKKALKLGADFVATGHYCQKMNIDGNYYLVKARDVSKDQTYFLNLIDGCCLSRVLFPLGDKLKVDVRKIAKKYNLSTQNKKDSTGICFIGERNFKNFLQNYINSTKGYFKNLNGDVVGEHEGLPFYTLGQRKGLGLGGSGLPWFVLFKDLQSNSIYVERGDHFKILYSSYLYVNDIHLICKETNIDFPFRCKAKIRYRQQDQNCVIEKSKGELFKYKITFDTQQRAITKGQYIVFYFKPKEGIEICLGGSRILTTQAEIERPGLID